MCEKAGVEEQERKVEEKEEGKVQEKKDEEEEEEEEKLKIRVKFVTNKERTKVLFAEAGSYFADTLLSFLLLPLGTIVKVLKREYGKKAPVIGSLNTLYNGIEELDSFHFLTEDAKSLLLNPTSLDDDGECPEFDRIFTATTASFVISDDIRVMLSVEGSVVSTLSSLGLALTDMEGAGTWNVDFGYIEILALLRAVLIYRNPLTALLLPGYGKRIGHVAEHEKATKKVGMKTISINSKKMILKVMMQKSTNKLLFAQAHHDFISFLFGLLLIPLGRVEWYLHSNTGLRTTDNLHRSIPESLYRNGLITPEPKDLLFKPDLPNDSSSKEGSSRAHYTDCGFGFVNEYIPLNFDRNEDQYHVLGARMYMVSDDLTVKPLSITSGISAIKEMKIALSDVEEVEIEVGFAEGLSIMRAALTSTTALTDGLIKPILKEQTKQEI